ncbi:glycosyltransferase family 4 protein [Desulfovibrio sp. JC022]|uniref:glycosyltransferase family 4 protein n=1 Tax=Desulfovibrio sp. JC022 TaxID=2593642 RepID=UPI0013D4FC0B|nr:glycosyltransferase family 4 protein [Desulfovibrio sp. JC022]NDV23493.1 glycosyltransferase family 4 protein [Desulfovibrio sp. JC022]
MRIAFFAPHKPIDHPQPSGDLIIGRTLHDFLHSQGHKLMIASRYRLRHITQKPLKWPSLYIEFKRTLKRVHQFKPDLWLTYHSYYKSPDLLGPYISAKLGIPYVIYQGVFATKYRRNHKTWVGYMANKHALLYADHVFANKDIDFHNLSRIILPEKLSRTYPGIEPDKFKHCPVGAKEIRNKLDLNGKKVILSAAMLREDVKAESITDLIKAFAPVAKEVPDAKLLIAGDGEARARLENFTAEKAGDKIIFLGQIKREELYKYYSAADFFAYPGKNEALGMVYLEAQCCGLPVVAYSTNGPKEAVANGETGLLSPEGNIAALSANLNSLLTDENQRKQMAKAAPEHVMNKFDLSKNLQDVEMKLTNIGSRRY